jgi:molybdate transport system substrate-binding protein
MEPKLKVSQAGGGGAVALLREGQAEMGVAAIATLFTPGVDYVGPLPAELQSYTVFTAAVGSNAKKQNAAAEFIKFVTAPAAAAAYKAKGMEPAPQR